MNNPDDEFIDQLLGVISERNEEVAFLKSLLNSFWTGDVPQGATLDHMKLAKYGRVRLAELAKTPALLAK